MSELSAYRRAQSGYNAAIAMSVGAQSRAMKDYWLRAAEQWQRKMNEVKP